MKCCICKKEFEGFGNNPMPIAGNKCCDECNYKVVIPLRLFFASVEKGNQALLIKKDSIEIVKPKKQYFTLKELQSHVGGYIELLPAPLVGYVTIFDEEGLLKELEFNELAHLTFDFELVGNVLICPLKIFKN